MAYSKKITPAQRKAIKNARRERSFLVRLTSERDVAIDKNVRAVSRYGK